MTTTSALRLYGVSTGDGNNGISHMFPSYYVKTNKPWRLARLAAVNEFKADVGRAWAMRHMDIDGEAMSTIAATFACPPCQSTADGEYPDVDNPEDAEDGRNWQENNGSWLIVEVFPEDSPRDGTTTYDSLSEAFPADLLAKVPDDDD